MPEWTGVGDVDAMLVRTSRWFADWESPHFAPDVREGPWETTGYAKVALDSERGDRKTQPLRGTFDLSLGQGAAELALTAEQTIAAKWDDHWKGISGAPVFSTVTGGEGLVGIITDANGALSNGLIGLPTARLLDDIRFRSIIAPSFLDPLPTRPWCLVLTAEGSSPDLVEQVAGVLTGHRDEDVLFGELYERPIEIRVVDAIGSVENWAVSVDALARADFMVADVTSFEPAVMLLLGIRSVLRRRRDSQRDGRRPAIRRSIRTRRLRRQVCRSTSRRQGSCRTTTRTSTTTSTARWRKAPRTWRGMRTTSTCPRFTRFGRRARRPGRTTTSTTCSSCVRSAKSYSDFYRRTLRQVIRAAHSHHDAAADVGPAIAVGSSVRRCTSRSGGPPTASSTGQSGAPT